MKAILFVNLFLFFLSFGCKTKEEAVKPLPKNNTSLTLDTIWRVNNQFSIMPAINSNYDVLVSEMFAPPGDVFKLFDGNSGVLKWQWNDYFSKEEGFRDLNSYFINDIMVLCSRSRTYAFDAISGKTKWRHKIDSLQGHPQIFKDINGDIFHSFSSILNPFRSYIYSAKYDLGNWSPICVFEDTSQKYNDIFITSIGFSKNMLGEKIMVFTVYLNSTLPDIGSTVRVCGFNMVTNKYEWVKDYSGKYVEFMVCKMASNDTKVFTYAVYGLNRYLIAINANDGSIAWQQSMPDLGVGIYPYKDKLISLSNGSRPVICVDQNTGNIAWKQNFTPEAIDNFNFTFGDSKIFKNYLISTQCDYLLVLNLDDGSVVYNKNIALPNGCLQFGVDINEEKRWLYVQDRNYINCYKLPDEVKY
jgi:outer membrane protein assembly factor BamB